MANFDCICAEDERENRDCRDAEDELDYFGEEPEDADLPNQVAAMAETMTRFGEWGWYALGGEMTAATRENLRNNCADWADAIAEHITKFLVESRLRQMGLKGNGADAADADED